MGAGLAHGASGEGASVTSAGVVPTPAIAYLTPAEGYDAGGGVSASHNPLKDKGIKCFSGGELKLAWGGEREVAAIMADSSWTERGGEAAPPGRADLAD